MCLSSLRLRWPRGGLHKHEDHGNKRAQVCQRCCINDDKPATGRVTLNKNELGRHEAGGDMSLSSLWDRTRRASISVPSMLQRVKKWLTIPQSPSIYISQDPRYPADWDL